MPSASIGDIHIGRNGAWKVPGGRWPAIGLAIVLVDVVCLYAFSLFAMDAKHFVWMSVNAGALVFGPVIWMEHRRLHRKGATSRERQSEKQREQERQDLEELQRKAQEAERQRLAELRREAERQRWQAEEGREAERRCQQELVSIVIAPITGHVRKCTASALPNPTDVHHIWRVGEPRRPEPPENPLGELMHKSSSMQSSTNV